MNIMKWNDYRVMPPFLWALKQNLITPYWLSLNTAYVLLPGFAGFRWHSCVDLQWRITYHTGSHTGLTTTEPRHGCRDWHLWWCKGDGASLGNIGVRRTMIYIIRAVKQTNKKTKHKLSFNRRGDRECAVQALWDLKEIIWSAASLTCETPYQSPPQSTCRAGQPLDWTHQPLGHHGWKPTLFH